MLRAMFGLVAALALPMAGGANAKDTPKAVLELFTSQGCSSCPAADALIGELAQRDDVLALTMPVKLWDFLGWADTLATDLVTKRQIAYSVARGDRDVYTPQVVLNGEAALLGSDRPAIEAAIEDAALPLPIDLTLARNVLTIKVGKATIEAPTATLWLLVIEEEVRVSVDEGENRGRRLTYHNVVTEMRPVGMWKGKPITLDLPLSDLDKTSTAGCVVIAQVEGFKGPGRILGAALIREMFPARTVDASRLHR